MYKELLQSIEGIEIFPLISLFIFLAFSVGVVIWIVKIDKGYVKEMEALPLDSDENTESLTKEISKN
jgi:cytochrome c oxidase cbb3-type subunit 4